MKPYLSVVGRAGTRHEVDGAAVGKTLRGDMKIASVTV